MSKPIDEIRKENGCYHFPSIRQFRNIIRYVKEYWPEKFYLTFVGTVKLHGTNCGIVLDKQGNITYQSRNRILTAEEDHYNFCKSFINKEDGIRSFVENQLSLIEYDERLVLFGEWAGKGIHKSSDIGITQLDKKFYLFGLLVDDTFVPSWRFPTTFSLGINIDNVARYETYKVEVNFNNPAQATQEIGQLVQDVEECCPIAKANGVNGLGEGLVWTCYEHPTNESFWFKTKGEKHSQSKVKKFVEVDPQKVKAAKEFAEYGVPEWRLEQGLEYLKEMGKPIDKSSTGDFLRWIGNDVLKEEMDVLEQSGLSKKDAMQEVNEKAKKWWFNYLEANFETLN